MSKPFQSGIVKWFSEHKGYGFIAREGAPDLFVHASDVRGPHEIGQPKLATGDQVSFLVIHNSKGDAAGEVRVNVRASDKTSHPRRD
jgi:CspA family cold shock protein